MLTFAVPYHSARMDPIRDELIGVLSSLRPSANTIPIVSTVSGTWVDGTTLDANHWWQNTRQNGALRRFGHDAAARLPGTRPCSR